MKSEWSNKNQNSSYRVNFSEILIKGKEILYELAVNSSYLSSS